MEEKLQEKREYQTQNIKLKIRYKLKQMMTNKVVGADDDTGRGGPVSAIMGPEMALTSEEKNILARFLRDQARACRHCCPVRQVQIFNYGQYDLSILYFQCVSSQSWSFPWISHHGRNVGCLHNLKKSSKLLSFYCYELNASFQ